jgi:hypothetical protein
MLKDDVEHNYHSTTHPFYINQVEVSIKKKTIHFADEVLHLVRELLDPSSSHYIDRLKGYTREHVQYFQAHVLGCMFGVGARFPHPPTDDYNGAHFGRKTVPSGTRLNVLMHVPSESAHGNVMSQFRKGLDEFTLLYEGGPQMLTIKVRCSSPFVESARRDGLIPRHSLENFPIPIMGYMLVHNGIPIEVTYYDGADTVTVVTNNNRHNIQLSITINAMNPWLLARLEARN